MVHHSNRRHEPLSELSEMRRIKHCEDKPADHLVDRAVYYWTSLYVQRETATAVICAAQNLEIYRPDSESSHGWEFTWLIQVQGSFRVDEPLAKPK